MRKLTCAQHANFGEIRYVIAESNIFLKEKLLMESNQIKARLDSAPTQLKIWRIFLISANNLELMKNSGKAWLVEFVNHHFLCQDYFHLMVNCWFGTRWFGFLESPKMKGIVSWVYPDSNPKAPGPKPTITLPETNIAMENPPVWWCLQGKMGFSWAMLVSGRVTISWWFRSPQQKHLKKAFFSEDWSWVNC